MKTAIGLVTIPCVLFLLPCNIKWKEKIVTLEIMKYFQFIVTSSPCIFLSFSLAFQTLCWTQFGINGNNFFSIATQSNSI
jgi:hypothetical protein